jgi:hypothetical protein
MTTNNIRDSLWKLLFLRPFDTAPREIMEAQKAARDAIAQARVDEVEVVIRSWLSDPAPTSPTEMPSEKLLDKWRHISCKVNESSGCEIPAHRTMAHLAIQWARSGEGAAPEPAPALPTKKMKEALKGLLELNPWRITIGQLIKAQDAVRDAIAQAEADEAVLAPASALELWEVEDFDDSEAIIFYDYNRDLPITLHRRKGSPLISLMGSVSVINFDRHQAQGLIATLNRWLNTGSFKFSASSQKPAP